MNTTMFERLEYIIDDYLVDNDIEYSQGDEGLVFPLKVNVATVDNQVMVIFKDTGYSIRMYPVGPDSIVVKKNIRELSYFCSLLNGYMENGLKIYIMDGKIIMEKFVDCIDSRNRIPAGSKISFNFSDMKSNYEKYYDFALMVNHGIYTAEQAFERLRER